MLSTIFPAVLLLTAAAIVYLEANRVPADYTPVALSPAQEAKARQSMANRFAEFASIAGRIGSWDPRERRRAAASAPASRAASASQAATQASFTITQAEVNAWTAATSRQFEGRLAKYGFSQPAIAFGDNRISFYSYWEKYDRVVAVDLSLNFTADGQMSVQLRRARIGELPLPKAIMEDYRAQLVSKVQQHMRQISAHSAAADGDSMQLFSSALRQIVDAMDGKPVTLDIRRHFGNIRIKRIDLEEGACTLELVPLN